MTTPVLNKEGLEKAWTAYAEAEWSAGRARNGFNRENFAVAIAAYLSHAAGDVAGLVTCERPTRPDFNSLPEFWQGYIEEMMARSKRDAEAILALSARTEAAEARVKEMEAVVEKLSASVEWFIANDETNQGDTPLPDRDGQTWNEINAYWINGLNAGNAALDAARSLSIKEADCCPVCAEPLKAGDTCASDIKLGTCHAECLEGSPIVDLDTGEPTEGSISTYPYEEAGNGQ